MFRSMYVNHTISALSHFHNGDLPLPFSNTDFYINIIRNLFFSKNSNEVVELGLIYDFTKDKSYMAISVSPKSYYISIKNLIDIKRFIQWFSNNYEELIFKHKYKTDNLIKTTYSYNDGYIRYSIILIESLNYPKNDQILIEYKTLN